VLLLILGVFELLLTPGLLAVFSTLDKNGSITRGFGPLLERRISFDKGGIMVEGVGYGEVGGVPREDIGEDDGDDMCFVEGPGR